jgi:hypothetical protein
MRPAGEDANGQIYAIYDSCMDVMTAVLTKENVSFTLRSVSLWVSNAVLMQCKFPHKNPYKQVPLLAFDAIVGKGRLVQEPIICSRIDTQAQRKPVAPSFICFTRLS